jgi:hypothetical protein
MLRDTRWRRRLAVELLEQKALLAGDITVAVVEGNLLIHGDRAGNALSIMSGGEAGAYILVGRPTDDGPTTLNGQEGPLRVTGVERQVMVDLGAGDDVLGIADAHFAHGVMIQTGLGNDRVMIGHVSDGDEASSSVADGMVSVVAGRLAIETGPDDDVVVQEGLRVRHGSLVHTGPGNDHVRIGAEVEANAPELVGFDPVIPAIDAAPPEASVAVGGQLLVDLGHGDDSLAIFATVAGDGVMGLGGSGNDHLRFDHVATPRGIRVDAGDGNDSVGIHHTRAAHLISHMGSGNDQVAIIEAVFRTLSTSMGAGDDELAIGHTTVYGFAHLNGGRGIDTFRNLGGNRIHILRLVGFERELEEG